MSFTVRDSRAPLIINCQRERPLFFTEREWAELKRISGCEDPYTSVSVGHGDVPVFKSSPGIPQMVSRPGTGPSRPSDQTIVGGVSTPVPRVVPSDVGTTGTVAKQSDTERIATNDGTTSMDVGDVLGGLAKAAEIYAQYKANQAIMQGGQGGQQFASNGNTTDGLGVPFVDVIPEASSDCKRQVWDPRADGGRGKWITKRKRRRRRLATASDIKDLSALKSVLGAGKGLDTWIATH